MKAKFSILILTCILTLGLVAVTPAIAKNVHFTNGTNTGMHIAICYQQGNNWVTTGWFRVMPNMSFNTNLPTNSHEVFVYGKSGFREWRGNENITLFVTPGIDSFTFHNNNHGGVPVVGVSFIRTNGSYTFR